jgi:hypothetical protein
MATSENNVITHGLSGKVGDLLVFSQRGGKTIVSTAPRKSGTESEAQKEHRRKFQRAVLYGKAAISDPATGDLYAAKAVTQKRQSFNVAVADFFNAPNIESVDVSDYTGRPGDIIRICATDDFTVGSVTVGIHNADGSLVEEGAATPDSTGYLWTYTATAVNNSLTGDRILITASDIPGNTVAEERSL